MTSQRRTIDTRSPSAHGEASVILEIGPTSTYPRSPTWTPEAFTQTGAPVPNSRAYQTAYQPVHSVQSDKRAGRTGALTGGALGLVSLAFFVFLLVVVVTTGEYPFGL